jgi:small-conductance mechanosensitive channel
MQILTSDALLKAAPFGFIVLGLVVGLVLERLVLPRVHSNLRGAFNGFLTLGTTALGAHFTLIAYPVRPDVLSGADQLLTVIVIASATIILARIVSRSMWQYLSEHREALPSASLFTTLAGITIWSVGALIALQSLGIAITPVLTALGVGGLAVALALKDTLENLFSGLQIIASRQIKPGDYIKLEAGSEGYVTDITWRTTTIRDLSNNLIVVPNMKLAQASFTNFALPDRELTVTVPVLVPYDANLEEVERVTLEVAREQLAALSPAGTFEPFLRFQEFGNENVKLTVFLRADEFVDQFKLRSEFMKQLRARYQSAGIRAPFPARTSEPAN